MFMMLFLFGFVWFCVSKLLGGLLFWFCVSNLLGGGGGLLFSVLNVVGRSVLCIDLICVFLSSRVSAAVDAVARLWIECNGGRSCVL